MDCVCIPLKMHHPVIILLEFVRYLVFSEKWLGSTLGYNKHCLQAFATLFVWDFCVRTTFLSSLSGIHEPDRRDECWWDGWEVPGLSRAQDKEGRSKVPAPQPLLAPATSGLLEPRPSLSILSQPLLL